MKTKFNWGYGIALLYSGFVIFIVMLVIGTFSQEVNLVAKDYYKQEIAYQQQIDKMQNLQEAPEKLAFTTTQNGILGITFPKNVRNGEMVFFRPSDYKKDFKIRLQLDENGQQFIPISSLENGLWRLKINWQAEGKQFYMEERIMVRDGGKVSLITKDKEVVINVNGVVRLTKDEDKKSRSERKLN